MSYYLTNSNDLAKIHFFIMVLPQLLDFLGVGNVLVRADDHAVLLVGEAVHLGADLLDRGFDLFAVYEDGYPAGAALCHKPVVCGKMSVPNRDGKGKPLSCCLTAVFVFLNTATTIAMVTSGLPRSLNG